MQIQNGQTVEHTKAILERIEAINNRLNPKLIFDWTLQDDGETYIKRHHYPHIEARVFPFTYGVYSLGITGQIQYGEILDLPDDTKHNEMLQYADEMLQYADSILNQKIVEWRGRELEQQRNNDRD